MQNTTMVFLEKYRFWLILFSAALIMQIPLVSIPFKWLESYFHEVSHGLAAILTGGAIVQIQLFPNGAGLCTTRGGIDFIISFFGYAGAALWGVLIYLMGAWHQRVAQIFTAIIALLLVLTLVFWVADILTFIIIALLLAVMLFKLKMSKLAYLSVTLQVTGVLVLLNSVKSPWYLIDGRSIGDGAALAQITGLPELLWVLIWFVIGFSSVVFLAKR